LLSQNDSEQMDVTVLGGGLAGMAALIHLVRAGLRVLCIEAGAVDTTPVGESLDWSAPEFLAELGHPMQKLIDEGFGTWKRHVTLQLAEGSMGHSVPGEWLGGGRRNLGCRLSRLPGVCGLGDAPDA
jgi:menaquinone-9 beta-reductase